MIPSGIILHNPGDLERDGDTFRYLGEVVPSRHPKLREFLNDTWGLRAILQNLLAYIVHDDIGTLGAAIERWAPPGSNDTAAYQAAVCQACEATNDTAFTVSWLHANAQKILDIITTREVGLVYPTAETGAAIDLITWPQETI
ncbi:MAG: hypothetical protein KGL39_45885 [Patescibacteria group bacterium]|nr:hypothetical protein [Patescibacteria group bacterium]